jgi:hypothetical protein
MGFPILPEALRKSTISAMRVSRLAWTGKVKSGQHTAVKEAEKALMTKAEEGNFELPEGWKKVSQSASCQELTANKKNCPIGHSVLF